MSLNQIRAKREQRHTYNTNAPKGVEAHAKTQEEYRRTVRSSVKSGRSEQSSGVGMKLRNQPRHKDHPAYRKSKGSVATESEEGRANATYIYRWMPQELAVLTTTQA